MVTSMRDAFAPSLTVNDALVDATVGLVTGGARQDDVSASPRISAAGTWHLVSIGGLGLLTTTLLVVGSGSLGGVSPSRLVALAILSVLVPVAFESRLAS